jgi:hypothetical protein
MRFYRVDFRDPSHLSHGYAFTTSLSAAHAAGKEFAAAHGGGCTYEVGHLDIDPTRAGILHALNLYGKHCDNG